ncbi:hypothetical protein JCM10212_006088 [Sporobolomyces blumeae]
MPTSLSRDVATSTPAPTLPSFGATIRPQHRAHRTPFASDICSQSNGNPSAGKCLAVIERESRERSYEGDDDFGPGDWGWGQFALVERGTRTIPVPDLTTVYLTWSIGLTSQVVGEPVVVTVYEGRDTTFTSTPQAVTYTLYPTTTEIHVVPVTDSETIYETSTLYLTSTARVSVTVVPPVETVTSTLPPTATTEGTVSAPTLSTSWSGDTLPTTPPPWLTLTSTETSRTRTSSGSGGQASSVPSEAGHSDCRRGDEHEQEDGLFDPTEEQVTSLYVMAIYLVGITIAWNLWGIRWLLNSFKTYTALVHEAGHMLGFALTALPLWRFTIDPNQGSATYTIPGRKIPRVALFLGQVSSIAFGGGLVFAGFNTVASKYASLPMAAIWLPVIWLQANFVSRLNCLVVVILVVVLWVVDHASGLRYLVLFHGVISSFYIIWDTIDDYVHRKQNECCVVMIESHTRTSAKVWFVVWLLIDLSVVSGCILAALAHWRQTPQGMYCQGQTFAPT